jgi:hypothetical protein
MVLVWRPRFQGGALGFRIWPFQGRSGMLSLMVCRRVGVVEWWNGGMVEWWNGGMVEWWNGVGDWLRVGGSRP